MKRPLLPEEAAPGKMHPDESLVLGPRGPGGTKQRLECSVDLQVARHFLHHSSLATADHHVSGACTSSPALVRLN